MSPADGEIPKTTMRWGVGITLTIVFSLGSALYTVSSNASARAAESKVLESRVNSMEAALMQVSQSVATIASDVSTIKTSQAEVAATLVANVSFLKQEMNELKRDVDKSLERPRRPE